MRHVELLPNQLLQSTRIKLPAASCGVFGEGESSRTANVFSSWRVSLYEPALFVKVRRVSTRSRRAFMKKVA
jgi:hypothetical protein